MRKLVSCEFNIDTACVDLRYADGEALSLYTPGIEDSFDTTLPMRTEMDWLIYNAPLEYAQMALDGTLEQYLREAAGTQVPSRFMRKFICRLRLNEVSRQ